VDRTELVKNTKYLLEKYLDKSRAEVLIKDFETELDQGKNIGKEVLHALVTEKSADLDSRDKELLKDVAHNMGL